MLKMLDDMFAKEEALVKQMKALEYQYKQLKDEQELLQTFIMFKSNRENRRRKYGLQ